MTSDGFNLRLFFAIELPPAVKASIAELITPLKKIFSHADNRWVKPENYHVTLQFLGSVDPLDVQRLIDKTRASTAAFTPFDCQLGSLEWFPPSSMKPKIISLQTGPHADLAALSAVVGVGMAATGYEPDPRLFRGHLTLCRLHAEQRAALAALPTLTVNIPAFRVRAVTLFRSEKIADSYAYTILEKFHAKYTD